jgi:hypothetical protein
MHSAVIKLKEMHAPSLRCRGCTNPPLGQGARSNVLYRDNVSIADRHHTLPAPGI